MFREMRRKDRQISEEGAYEILKNSEYGILSTVSEDGSPYGIPLSFVLSGNCIYFHSAKKGHKIDNISGNSRVCFTAVGRTRVIPEDFTTEFESAVAFGTAEFIENKEEKLAAALKLCEKYSPDYMENAKMYALKDMDLMCICAIKVEHITGKVLVKK